MLTMKISVVIVTYNISGLIAECLRTLKEALSEFESEIIIVDNESKDNTLAIVAQVAPDCKIIQNRKNVGFCVANNQGFAIAKGEYIMLLNADTEVKPDAIKRLIQVLESDKSIWAVGPDLPQPRDPVEILACGYQPTLWNSFCQYFMLSFLFPRSRYFSGTNLYRKANYSTPVHVEWISGACILTRRSVIDLIGGLDESIFMYADDFEWCNRVISAGGRILYVPDAVVVHFAGSQSIKINLLSSLKIWADSWICYFMRLHGKFQTFLFVLLTVMAYFLRALFFKILEYIPIFKKLKGKWKFYAVVGFFCITAFKNALIRCSKMFDNEMSRGKAL